MLQGLAPVVHDLVKKSPSRDFRIVEGSTNVWTLVLPTSIGLVLSNYAGRSEFRRGPRDRYPSDDDVLARAAVRIVTVGPRRRALQFVLTAEESTKLAGVLRGYWDAEIFNGTVVWRAFQGTWTKNPEVTN